MSKEVESIDWKWGITVASKKLGTQSDIHIQVSLKTKIIQSHHPWSPL